MRVVVEPVLRTLGFEPGKDVVIVRRASGPVRQLPVRGLLQLLDGLDRTVWRPGIPMVLAKEVVAAELGPDADEFLLGLVEDPEPEVAGSDVVATELALGLFDVHGPLYTSWFLRVKAGRAAKPAQPSA